jgi:spore germination protein YaaH
MIRRTLILAALLALALPAAAQAAPGAPAGLSVRPSGKSAAVVSWDAAQGAKRYRLLRAGRKVRDTKLRTLKVRLGAAKVRYQVVAIDKRGRLGRRSSAVILLRGHSAPRAPVAAAATNVTGSAATLTWGRSKAARARVASYRVLSGDRTVRSVKGTTVRLTKLAASRTLTYRVVALDTLGWASKPSGPITVVTGHTAPSPPGAPVIAAVGDTTLSLTWAAAKLPEESTLRGYRLLRDGVVVSQVAGASANLTNLAAKSAHDWSVAALDTRGYASAPSPVTRVVQGDPAPSTGVAHAFLLASTDSSFVAFQKRYKQIGVVYPTFFDCNLETGAIEGANDALIVGFAQDRKVKVLPRFNCQKTSLLHTILTDAATRARWIDTMVASTDQYGYDGVNLDFEAVAAADRNALTAFVAELSGRLHAKGRLLSQAVSSKTSDVQNHPRSTAFDYVALSQYDDYLFVMAWGLHWSTSTPGAQDDLSWVRQIADYVATMPNKQKFVMGTMLYGFDWPAGGGASHPGTALHYGEIQALAAQYGVQPAYDVAADSWRLAYTDASGVPHDVWYSDASVVGRRIALAHDRGLGVGFWRIGQEDERMWENPALPGATG